VVEGLAALQCTGVNEECLNIDSILFHHQPIESPPINNATAADIKPSTIDPASAVENTLSFLVFGHVSPISFSSLIRVAVAARSSTIM
jgi:hypothetical protein